ncbi:MAG: hypothetical protein ABSG22_05220 [Sedimentisphaerales bacterium]|jgi:hypothetical protein
MIQVCGVIVKAIEARRVVWEGKKRSLGAVDKWPIMSYIKQFIIEWVYVPRRA